MIIRCFAIAIIVFAWVMPVRADDSAAKPEKRLAVVAEMGDVKISDAEYDVLASHLTPEAREALEKDASFRTKFVQDAIVKKYLLSQARSSGFDKKPLTRERMDLAAEQSLIGQYVASQAEPASDFPTDAEVKSFYDKNKDAVRKPGQAHVAQIFIGVPQNADGNFRKGARTRIYQIFKEVVAAPKKFGDVAKLKSEHQDSAAKGGDLGWLNGDQMLPEMVSVIGTMQPNEISSPVQSAGGWHILKLLEVRKGDVLPFNEAKTTLIGAMRHQEIQKKEQEFFKQLMTSQPPKVLIK
ncbi:MAG: peptidylprolyl isomerase [Magnetococcales bacterium]|nr:peptidylprolyl isomerase [Magnetococcales bacterium]